jgi:hypothetical protein
MTRGIEQIARRVYDGGETEEAKVEQKKECNWE